MKKIPGNKQIVFLIFIAVLIAAIFVTLTFADSDTLDVTTTSTNYDPVVVNCIISDGNTTQNPTESSTTSIAVKFNVSDTNGNADLNNSLAKVEFDDATTWAAKYESAENTSCAVSVSSANATTRTYECTVPMQYWYQHTTNYSIRCYAGDKNDSTLVTKDNNNAFDYTKLAASSVDGTAVAFAVTSGEYSSNVSDSNSPVNITNTGNAALTTISVTGANATQTGRSDIDSTRFYADDDNGVAGAQQLNTSSQQITGVSVPIEDATAGGNTDSLWLWFNVPATLEAGTYSASWTLTEAE